MTTSLRPRSARRWASWRANQSAALAAAAALVLILVTLGGYFAGVHHGSRTTVLTGNFYVGDHVTTARIGDWAYGTSGSVSWVDGQGSTHDDGWPDCLRMGSTVRVRFGEVPVQGPSGESWRQIVWFDCRTARVIRP
jgi:hypothetical protein